MGARREMAKSWGAILIAVVGAVGAAFSYLQQETLRENAKGELAATDVAFQRVAERVAKLEGKEESRERHCACLPKAIDVAAVMPSGVFEGPGESNAPEHEHRPVRKPSRDDPMVQRRLGEYDW